MRRYEGEEQAAGSNGWIRTPQREDHGSSSTADESFFRGREEKASAEPLEFAVGSRGSRHPLAGQPTGVPGYWRSPQTERVTPPLFSQDRPQRNAISPVDDISAPQSTRGERDRHVEEDEGGAMRREEEVKEGREDPMSISSLISELAAARDGPLQDSVLYGEEQYKRNRFALNRHRYRSELDRRGTQSSSRGSTEDFAVSRHSSASTQTSPALSDSDLGDSRGYASSGGISGDYGLPLGPSSPPPAFKQRPERPHTDHPRQLVDRNGPRLFGQLQPQDLRGTEHHHQPGAVKPRVWQGLSQGVGPRWEGGEVGRGQRREDVTAFDRSPPRGSAATGSSSMSQSTSSPQDHVRSASVNLLAAMSELQDQPHVVSKLADVLKEVVLAQGSDEKRRVEEEGGQTRSQERVVEEADEGEMRGRGMEEEVEEDVETEGERRRKRERGSDYGSSPPSASGRVTPLSVLHRLQQDPLARRRSSLLFREEDEQSYEGGSQSSAMSRDQEDPVRLLQAALETLKQRRSKHERRQEGEGEGRRFRRRKEMSEIEEAESDEEEDAEEEEERWDVRQASKSWRSSVAKRTGRDGKEKERGQVMRRGDLDDMALSGRGLGAKGLERRRRVEVEEEGRRVARSELLGAPQSARHTANGHKEEEMEELQGLEQRASSSESSTDPATAIFRLIAASTGHVEPEVWEQALRAAGILSVGAAAVVGAQGEPSLIKAPVAANSVRSQPQQQKALHTPGLTASSTSTPVTRRIPSTSPSPTESQSSALVPPPITEVEVSRIPPPSLSVPRPQHPQGQDAAASSTSFHPPPASYPASPSPSLTARGETLSTSLASTHRLGEGSEREEDPDSWLQSSASSTPARQGSNITPTPRTEVATPSSSISRAESTFSMMRRQPQHPQTLKGSMASGMRQLPASLRGAFPPQSPSRPEGLGSYAGAAPFSPGVRPSEIRIPAPSSPAPSSIWPVGTPGTHLGNSVSGLTSRSLDASGFSSVMSPNSTLSVATQDDNDIQPIRIVRVSEATWGGKDSSDRGGSNTDSITTPQRRFHRAALSSKPRTSPRPKGRAAPPTPPGLLLGKGAGPSPRAAAQAKAAPLPPGVSSPETKSTRSLALGRPPLSPQPRLAGRLQEEPTPIPSSSGPVSQEVEDSKEEEAAGKGGEDRTMAGVESLLKRVNALTPATTPDTPSTISSQPKASHSSRDLPPPPPGKSQDAPPSRAPPAAAKVRAPTTTSSSAKKPQGSAAPPPPPPSTSRGALPPPPPPQHPPQDFMRQSSRRLGLREDVPQGSENASTVYSDDEDMTEATDPSTGTQDVGHEVLTETLQSEVAAKELQNAVDNKKWRSKILKVWLMNEAQWFRGRVSVRRAFVRVKVKRRLRRDRVILQLPTPEITVRQ